MSDFVPYPGVGSFTHVGFEASVSASELDRGFVAVDSNFAQRLLTTHSHWFKGTLEGQQTFTRDVPNLGEEALAHLDERGLATIGTLVKPGMVLIGRVAPREGLPLSPEEKLLRAIFGDAAGELVDRSLGTPGGVVGTVSAVEVEATRARVEVSWSRPLEVGDVLELNGALAVVASISALPTDLAWSGGAGRATVRKHAIARDALEARSIGQYDLDTQQPVKGRAAFGGQAFDTRLASTLSARAPWSVWESLTLKSDSVNARIRAYESQVKRENPGGDYGPLSEAPTTSGMSDIFSFFERPKVGAGVPPEALTRVLALLRAMGLELKGEVPATARWLEDDELRTSIEVARGELQSQRCFGPLADYECECGKYKRMKHRGTVCETCGVEVVQSKVRRERFGFVGLKVPGQHPLRATPMSVLAVLPAGLRAPNSKLDGLYDDVQAASDAGAVQHAVDALFAELTAQLEQSWAHVFDKTVDFSGRAHVTVDPSLTPGTCRVPRAMLTELFRPMVYGLLEARGFVTTIKSAKRMVEQDRFEIRRAVEAVSAGYPLWLVSGHAVISRTPIAWDEQALAVDAETARTLADTVLRVFLPVTTQAAVECAGWRDAPLSAVSTPTGWLASARGAAVLSKVVHAANEGEADPLDDFAVRAAFGVVPPASDAAVLSAWEEAWRAREAAVSIVDEAAVAAAAATTPDWFSRSLDDLEMSVNTANVLANLELKTVGDLCRRTEAELLKSKGFGRRNLKEVKELLAELQLSLGMR